MTPFERALSFTLRWEGGWGDDPDDPGRETYRGVSRTRNPNWPGWVRVDAIKVSGETPRIGMDPALERDVATLYRQKYWAVNGLDAVSPRIGLVVFDFGVQHGVQRAARALQRQVGAKPDGVIGEKTRAAVWAAPEIETAHGVVVRRAALMARWIQAVPARSKYVGGFFNRLLDLELEMHRG